MKRNFLVFFLVFCIASNVGGEGNSEPLLGEKGEEEPSYLVLHARESCLCVDPELLEKFENKKNDIRIIPSRRNRKGYEVGIPELFESDWPPDMIQMESGYSFRQWGKEGKLKRIATLASGYGESLSLPFDAKGDGSEYMASIWRNWSGFLYHSEMTQEFSSDIPSEWTLFLELCKSIRDTGVAPLYTDRSVENTFFWFDYLDLRINGADFHSRLLSGEASFSSPEMKNVFRIWSELIRLELFFFDEASDWEAVYQNREAAFFLINRVEWVDAVSDLTSVSGLCEFPHLMFTIERGEIAPASGLVFPDKSSGKKGVADFLFYLRESVKQESLRSHYSLDFPTEDNFHSSPVRYFNRFYKEVPPDYSDQLGKILVGIWSIEEDVAIQLLSEIMESVRKQFFPE